MYTGNTAKSETYPKQDIDCHQSSIPERTLAEHQPIMMRRNPRLVIGGLEYFELLMEQEEQ